MPAAANPQRERSATRLTKLEIQGFKSFADRVAFEFGCGITALVGPNGSGKSNVVDALRWAFGEQNPRLLRGTRWEDGVFAGSSTRRPLGMAEVSVTLDNSEGALPVPYREVELSRRLMRSGDAEYAINRVPCRLKEILDLLSGTGAGGAAYAYMPQAAVDEILKSRPEDRREVLEEAAGLARYRVRRQEAQRRLAEVDAARQRVQDLIAELDAQLAPLRREAETAARFVSLRTEREDIAARLWADSMSRLERRIRGAAAKHDEYSRRRDDIAKTFRGLEEEVSALEGALGRARRLRGDAEGRVKALLAEENRRRAAAAVLKERLTSRRNELAAAALRLEAVRARQADLRGELGGCAAEPGAGRAGGGSPVSAAAAPDAIAHLAGLERQVKEAEAALSAALEAQGSLRRREASLRDRSGAAQNNLTLSRERAASGRRQLVSRSGRLAAARRELEVCREALKRSHADRAAAAAGAVAASEALESARAELAALDEQLREARDRLAGQQSLVARLEGELLVSEESLVAIDAAQGRLPLAAAAREVAEVAASRSLSRIARPLADLMSVEAGLEKAVAAALGLAQHALLVDDWDAVRAIFRLQAGGDLQGLGVLAPAGIARPCGIGALPHGVRPLRPLAATRDPELLPDALLDDLLGGYALVSGLDEAIALTGEHAELRGAVTLDGLAVLAGGVVVTAEGQCTEDNLILLNRDRARLAERAASAREQLTAARREVADLQQRTSDLHSQVRELAAAVRAAEKDVDAASRRTAELAAGEGRTAARAEALEREIASLADEVASLNGSLASAEQDAAEAERQQRDASAEHGGVAAQLKQAEDTVSAAAGVAQSLRLQLTRMQEAAKAEVERRSRLEAELKRLAAEAAEALEAEQQASGEALVLERECASAEGAVARCRDERQAAEADVRQLQAQLQAQELTVRNYRSEADKLAAARADVDRRLHRLELTQERMAGESRSLQVEKKALPPRHAAIEPRPDPEAASLRARSEEIESQLLAMGSVDLSAAEQCRRLSERYAFLTAQERDLAASEGSLQASALEIEREIESRLMRSFEETRRRFGEVFAGLFGGGRADLELTDPEHPLTSGVEVMAQPPGKRMTSLALLSGGERALTAIALLFALLGRSRTGFCVLDEVDAYLDEPNCLRFRRYLRSLSGDRQFLVVTHNKSTMEAADVLYGLTMEEDGVSRAVSVRLDDPAADGRAG